MSGFADYLSVALGVAWRIVHKILKNPALLAPQLVFPLLFFVAFAGGLSGLDNLPRFEFAPGYDAFVFVFVLLQSAAFGGVFTGFGIASDFEWGFARRLFLAAPHRSALVLGYALAALARWGATAVLVTIVAFIAGMQVGGSGIDLAALFTLALLVNSAGLLFACGVAMRFRTMQAGPLMQLPVFMALFFMPVYVPIELLDGWMETAASVNPLTHILESGRSLIAGTPQEVLLAYVLALAVVAGFAIWAVRGIRSAERSAA